MKISGLDILPGLEEAYFKVVQFGSDVLQDTLLRRIPPPARGRRYLYRDRSYFITFEPIYDALSATVKGHWTTYWGTLPFGDHSGAGNWPGSGYSAFVWLNAPRYKRGLPLILDPYPPSFTFNSVNTSPAGRLWAVDFMASENVLLAPYRDATARKFVAVGNPSSWFSTTMPSSVFPHDAIFIPDWTLYIISGSGSGFTCFIRTADGTSWTTSALDSGSYVSMAYSPLRKRLVAAGQGGGFTTRLAYTDDGVSWLSGSSPEIGQLAAVVWDENLKQYVAISNVATGNHAITSQTGVDWVEQSTPALDALTDMAFSPTLQKYVAVGGSALDPQMMTSSDGKTWDDFSFACPAHLSLVEWSPELGCFLAANVAGSDTTFYASIDGLAFVAVGGPYSFSPSQIKWIADLGCFVMPGLSRVMYTS